MTLDEALAALARRGYSGLAAQGAAQVIANGLTRSAVTRVLAKVEVKKTCKCCGHTHQVVQL